MTNTTSAVTSINDLLKTQLSDIIAGIKNGSVKVFEWANGQVPEVIQQFLTWKLLESLLWFSVGAIVFFFCVTGTRRSWKSTTLTSGDREGFAFLYSIGALIGLIISMFNLTWVKIWIAPKMYLIEYVIELVK